MPLWWHGQTIPGHSLDFSKKQFFIFMARRIFVESSKSIVLIIVVFFRLYRIKCKNWLHKSIQINVESQRAQKWHVPHCDKVNGPSPSLKWEIHTQSYKLCFQFIAEFDTFSGFQCSRGFLTVLSVLCRHHIQPNRQIMMFCWGKCVLKCSNLTSERLDQEWMGDDDKWNSGRSSFPDRDDLHRVE